MAKKRKLFIAHASELAHRLVRAVRPHGLVAVFATSYARRHHRTGVVDDPQRLRELEFTLGREAILVMVAEALHRLPSALGERKGHPLDAEEASFAQIFLPEFMTALVRVLEWPAAAEGSERDEFDRDLLMYRRWREHSPSSDPALLQNRTSPFLDRCALLLDPSTMEQARAAAAKFEKELADVAARIVSQLGMAGAEKARPRKSPRRPAARRKPPARKSKRKKVTKRRRQRR